MDGPPSGKAPLIAVGSSGIDVKQVLQVHSPEHFRGRRAQSTEPEGTARRADLARAEINTPSSRLEGTVTHDKLNTR